MTALALQSTAASVRVQNVRFRQVRASEWVKLWSLRSTVLTLLAAVVAMVLIG